VTQQTVKIGLYGKGALNAMFLSTAHEVMPKAVFYERSAKFLNFRKREIELGKTKFADPKTAIRDLPLGELDLKIHFVQTQFDDTEIKTRVTIVHTASKKEKVLHFSVKEKDIKKDNMEEVFHSHSLRIISAVQNLLTKPTPTNQTSIVRPSTVVRSGSGHSGYRIRGPFGLKES
jgi:hypothetical protein